MTSNQIIPYTTDDFQFTSYWLLIGGKINKLEPSGFRILFVLPEEAEKTHQEWRLNPTEEQKTIQVYEEKRRQVLKAVKDKQIKIKSNGGHYG